MKLQDPRSRGRILKLRKFELSLPKKYIFCHTWPCWQTISKQLGKGVALLSGNYVSIESAGFSIDSAGFSIDSSGIPTACFLPLNQSISKVDHSVKSF